MHRFSVLNLISTIQGCRHGDLRNEQLIAHFVQYCKKINENIICINFQLHNPKLSHVSCFILFIYYAMLFEGRSTKEATSSFLFRAL